MNKVEKYLSLFDDYELASFWKYRLDSYMDRTQKQIKAYLNNRNLNETKMIALMEEYAQKSFSKNELRCPRCKCKKIITKEEQKFASNDNLEFRADLIEFNDVNNLKVDCFCAICGLSFSTKENSFIEGAWNFLLTLLSLNFLKK